MNITVTKKTLTDALALLERIIPTRSSNPTLTALHVPATESGPTPPGPCHAWSVLGITGFGANGEPKPVPG